MNFIPATFLFVFISIANSASSQASRYQIMRTISEIDQDSGYSVVEIKTNKEFSGKRKAVNATLTGFYKNNALKKIVEYTVFSATVTQHKFYLDSGQVIYASHFESDIIPADSSKRDRSKTYEIYMRQYFFHKERFIGGSWTDKIYSDEADEAIKQLGIFREYKKQLDKKRRKS